MRLLVCGSRNYRDEAHLSSIFHDRRNDLLPLYALIHGDCEGPDQWSELEITIRRGWETEVLVFPITDEDWKRHGKSAGPLRNQRMLDEGRPTLVWAFWDGKSPGTRDMILRAVRAGVEVNIFPPRKD